MERPRFFHRPLNAGSAELEPDEAHHLLRALKLRTGGEIELFDGLGGLAEAVISEIRQNRVFVETGKISVCNRPQTGRIIIASSIAKGQRFDWMLSKCAELGADHIAAVLFERTVKLGSTNARNKYQKQLIAACKQCKRLFVPELSGPQNLRQTLDKLACDYPDAKVLFGGFGPKALNITQLPVNKKDAVVFIGPEGGLTDAEKAFLIEHGAIEIKLASNVLRVETAAVAFTAILEALRVSSPRQSPSA